MKKLLVLALTAVFVLSMVSSAMAAVVWTGGNLREWYINAYNDVPNPLAGPQNSLNGFQFDRVEIGVKAEFNKTEGLSALMQWRGYANKPNDARLDSGFYYKKGLFSKYDEIDVGALDKLPFRLGLSKNVNFVDTGLGSKLKVGNSTGVRYELLNPNYTIGLGIVNANMTQQYNDSGNDKTEGYAYSVRLDAGKNFFGLVDGLRLGVGYNRMGNNSNDSGKYTMNSVIDIAYVTDLFWASLEHGGQLDRSVNRWAVGYGTADYFELGFNFDPAKIWVGRLIAGKNAIATVAYKDPMTGKVISGVNDGTILAGSYAFKNKISLQGQIIVPDKTATMDAKEFDLRFRYDF